MKTRPVLMTLIAFVASALVAAPAEAKQFRWKLEPGQKFVFSMDQVVDQKVPNPQGGEIAVTAKMTVEGIWEVKDKDADGNVTVEQKFSRMKMDLNMPGQKVVVDSADEKSLETPTGRLFGGMLKQLKNLVVVQKIAPTGKTLETTAKVPDGGGAPAGGLPGLNPDQLKQMAKESLLAFPETDLSKGDTWKDTMEIDVPQVGKMKVTTEYTYAGTETVDGKKLDKFEGKVSFAPENGDGNGGFRGNGTVVVYFDAEAGRVSHGSTEQNMVIEQNLFGQAITAKVSVKGKSKLKPAE